MRLLVRPDSVSPARDPFQFYGFPPESRLTVETVPGGAPGPARRARFLVHVAGAALARRGDVVYTRDAGAAALIAAAPRRWRAPLVYEAHGVAAIVAAELPTLLGRDHTAPSPAKLARLEARERRVWTRAEAIVTLTRALADDLAARYGRREVVFVVPDGARATPEVTSEVASEVTSGVAVAAYAGHLYPWKGVDVFVRALAQLPNLRGLIVGGHDGEPDVARVRSLVDALGIGERVEITGLVPPGAVASRIAAASVLVLPNTATAISERYTSPLKLFEYLMLGKPIVASRLPALAEVLTDEQTALLVAPDDAGALAAGLSRIISDPALASRLGRAALALSPQFTWDRRAERIEAALQAAARR